MFSLDLDFRPLVGRMRQLEKGVYRSVTADGIKTLIYQDILRSGYVRERNVVTGATSDSIEQLMDSDGDGRSRINVEPETHTAGVYIRESGGYIDDSGIYIDPVDLYKGRNYHYGWAAVDSSFLSDYSLNYDDVATRSGKKTNKDAIIEIIKRHLKQ